MAERSKIEWTDSTFNPWIGCTQVSPGCDHCYAEAQNKFRGWAEWGPHGERTRTSEANWKKPKQWNAAAGTFERETGRRRRVFCASLADVFDNQVPESWRVDLFDLIRATPSLDWQLLTKRPQNIAKMLPPDWGDGYHNVWLGATAEDQTRYRQRWPVLDRIPASVRFISYEPAIGPLGDLAVGSTPDWIISGGESGPHARPMAASWARQVRDNCKARGIAYLHKQWGDYRNNPLVAEQSMAVSEARLIDVDGKGGARLDGCLHRAFPRPRPVGCIAA
jgi:protein gp37